MILKVKFPAEKLEISIHVYTIAFSRGHLWYAYPFLISETMEKKLVEETKQLELDLNDERLRYQNLLNEFSRLEERYDDLKEEMTLMVVSQTLLLFLMKNFKHIQK